MSFITQKKRHKNLSLTDGFCIIHSDPSLLPPPELRALASGTWPSNSGGKKEKIPKNWKLCYGLEFDFMK